MTDKYFNHASHLAASGGLDLGAAGTAGDLEVILVMTGWVYATYKDATAVSTLALGTYEFDGSGYARKVLGTTALAKDAGNNRSELTAAATIWAALGQGANPAIGALLVWDDGQSGNDTLTIPVAYWDSGGFPKDGTGSEFRITWNAEGLLQAASAT